MLEKSVPGIFYTFIIIIEMNDEKKISLLSFNKCEWIEICYFFSFPRNIEYFA